MSARILVIDDEERYRTNIEAIFRSVRDAIITVDKEAVVSELNEAAMNLPQLEVFFIGLGQETRPM